MGIFLIIGALFGLSYLGYKTTKDDDHPFVILPAIIGLIVWFFSGIILISNHLTATSDIARIESLRETVSRVSPESSEDVYGQVADVNKGLASARAYNKAWWSDWFIPDSLADVKPIDIGRAKMGEGDLKP